MDLSFDAIRKTVLDAKPVFAQVLEEHGSESVYDYFARATSNVLAVPEHRKKEFLSVFRDMTARILGEDVANRAAAELAESWYVSTADHHGILTDPYFGSSALVQSFVSRAAGRTTAIALPCGGISISNATFPRGFLLHDDMLAMVRLHLVSRTESTATVFGKESYGQVQMGLLAKEMHASALSQALKEKFERSIMPLLENTLYRGFAGYAEQVTHLNFNLWKQIPGERDTDLVYLEQESLVAELILRHHLGRETVIGKLLSSKQYQESFAKQFDGISGAHSAQEEKGTFLFWAIESGKRIALRAGDARIVTTESIRSGLSSRTLMPGMALTYCVLAFYYGLTCGGGFSQVGYLTEMKQAYVRMLEELGVLANERTLLDSISTREFCGDLLLAMLSSGAEIAPATPIDLILRADAGHMETLKQFSRKLSLKDATLPLFLELYRIVTKGSVSKDAQTGYTPPIYEESALPVLRNKSD